MSELAPLILAIGLTFILGILAVNKFDKLKYYCKEFDSLKDNEERESLKWYVRYLRLHANSAIILIVFYDLLVYLFRDYISNFMDQPGTRLLVIGFSFSTGIAVLFWIIAKSTKKNINTTLKTDLRPPVLFLRSFIRDGETFSTIFDLGNKSGKKIFSYESMLLQHINLAGPIIAVASPNTKEDAILGEAAKQQFKDWENSVTELMKKSSLIIFQPYDSPGILWEFKQLVMHDHLSKTIFIINIRGENPDANQKSISAFMDKARTEFNIDFGDRNKITSINYFDSPTTIKNCDSYFDIPQFRKVFYYQFILTKMRKESNHKLK